MQTDVVRQVPASVRWYLAAGIVATVCANLAHGLGHGAIGALISAWPALAPSLRGKLGLGSEQARHPVSVR